MANSPTEICNLALAHLGEAPIQSLDEDSTAARACALKYVTTRDAILRRHRWNFATQRASLSALSTAPKFGWSYQFQLPDNCLRVLEFNGTESGDEISDEYVIEGRCLLTDESTADIVYIQQISNEAIFDSLFVEAFAVKLAVELSEIIRGTTGKTQELLDAYERLTGPLARRVDANEGRRRKGLLPINSMFVRARYRGV